MAAKPTPQEERDFENRWTQAVDEAARMSGWQEDLQGTFMEPDREPLSVAEEEAFLERFGTFLQEANRYKKTAMEFMAAVKKRAKELANQATNEDERNLYAEVEADIDTRSKDFTQVLNREEVQQRLEAEMVRYGMTSEMRLTGKYKKFIDNMNEMIDMYEQLDLTNRTINILKFQLQDLYREYRAAEDQEEEDQLRGDILAVQTAINQELTARSKVQKEMGKKRGKYQKVIELVTRILEDEKRKIRGQWGGKVRNLLNQRQALQEQLSGYDKRAPEHVIGRDKIMGQMEKIDQELQKLKKQIANYKAGQWVFVFEHYLGHKSIPALSNERKEVTTIDPMLGMAPYSEFEEVLDEEGYIELDEDDIEEVDPRDAGGGRGYGI